MFGKSIEKSLVAAFMAHRPAMRKPSSGILYSLRNFHASAVSNNGPVDVSKMLSNLDMLGLSNQPSNNIESVLKDGIRFSNGVVIKSPNKNKDIIGSILLGGEAFELNLSGMPELKDNQQRQPLYTIKNNFLVKFNEQALSIFKLSHPKPELIVVGLGKKSRILHDSNRKFFNSLGILIEISDTRNACQNFDLLATERPNQIAALLLPPNL